MADVKKRLEAHKFINAVIGISDKMTCAMFAATIGLGGQEIIRKGICDIGKLCTQWKEQALRAKDGDNEKRR